VTSPVRAGALLMTGGSGFIGRHLSAALASSGFSLVNLDLVAPPRGAAYERTVIGDVRDEARVREAMAGCDGVFHLAAAHHDFGIARPTFFDVNETGTETLCRVMGEHGVRRICFYSTVAVYGDGDDERDEASATLGTTPYGQSKLAGERVLERWSAAAPGRSALVIRPSVVFGPFHFANMYTLVRQIHRGRFLPVGDGRNQKSLAYVANLVDATLFLWSRLALAPPFEVFNYADKPDLTSGEIAAHVYRALSKSPPSFSLPLPFALAAALPLDLVARVTGRNLPVSAARIRKLAVQRTRYAADKVRALGFVPRRTLEDGLREMVGWYLHEGHALTPVRSLPPARAEVAVSSA
jgi:nucleoside-diphosphate-sugar epimerase